MMTSVLNFFIKENIYKPSECNLQSCPYYKKKNHVTFYFLQTHSAETSLKCNPENRFFYVLTDLEGEPASISQNPCVPFCLSAAIYQYEQK